MQNDVHLQGKYAITSTLHGEPDKLSLLSVLTI